MTTTCDDASLAAQAALDPGAFAALYDRYYARVYGYLRYRCSDAAQAEDLAAQVFLRLLSAIGRYDPARAPFAAWLFAIARHTAGDALRALRLRAWLPWERALRLPDPAPLPEEALLRRELSERLAGALTGLSPRERDLLGLKFAAGLTNRQIAAIADLTEGHVAVILYRALRRLRARLDERESEVMSDARA